MKNNDTNQKKADKKANLKAEQKTTLSDIDYQYHLLYLPRGIERLEKLGETKTFLKGVNLNKIDEVPDCCYVVKSGRVICYELSYNGDHWAYNIMEPCSILMEDCLLSGRACPVLFKTMEKCELIQIERCKLIHAMKNDIDLVMDICESLSIKFLSAMEHLRLGSRQSASWKICKMLVIYTYHYGRTQDDGSVMLEKKLSHQMLADILSLNRVTVTRKMKELHEMGLVENVNGYLRFRDIRALEEHMLEIKET